ncbi:uncharacterized protein LOC106763555 [Vigna radiata var. radiata]|uniref:Uncharacterized protein LOC106763555 n=1 Tax=Vigna radiata var. radiata TaxID=3916 RepID=A0A1S3UB68_VIGRR|nr:uncharacterized protein LOC106763555 [Vigna radiata var. radiata]
MEITTPLTEALQQTPVYARHVKPYIGEEIEKAMEEFCNGPLKRKHPPKMKDPGGLTIPCTIGSVKIGRALLDSSINLMPLSMLKKIGGLTLKPTNISLVVVDGSSKKPYGVVEDVVIRVESVEFLVDFVIIKMKEDDRIPLILERSFMKTTKVVISVYDGVIMLKDQEEKVIYNLSKEKQMRIKKRAKYKASKKDAAVDRPESAKVVNKGNNCVLMLVKEEEKVGKGGIVHFDLKDALFKLGTPVKYKKKMWVVKGFQENRVIEIEDPYSKRVEKVDRKQLMSWCD